MILFWHFPEKYHFTYYPIYQYFTAAIRPQNDTLILFSRKAFIHESEKMAKEAT